MVCDLESRPRSPLPPEPLRHPHCEQQSAACGCALVVRTVHAEAALATTAVEATATGESDSPNRKPPLGGSPPLKLARPCGQPGRHSRGDKKHTPGNIKNIAPQAKYTNGHEMILELVSQADLWCKIHCKSSPPSRWRGSPGPRPQGNILKVKYFMFLLSRVCGMFCPKSLCDASETFNLSVGALWPAVFVFIVLVQVAGTQNGHESVF